MALAGLAVRLGLEPDTGNPQAWESAREWLEHHGRWLLLCDNAASYDAIAGLLPRGGDRQASPSPLSAVASVAG